MPIEAGEREALCAAPVVLYGLPDLGPRTISSNYDGQPPSLVKLGHGTREDPNLPWVEVIVHGPLHGFYDHMPGGARATWQEYPETLPLFHVIVSANPMISGAALPAAQAALGERWTPVQLHVDGALRAFKMVRRGVHWGALRRMEAVAQTNEGRGKLCACHN